MTASTTNCGMDPTQVPPGPLQASKQVVVLSTHNQSQDPIYTVGYCGKNPQSHWVKSSGLKTLYLPCETKLGGQNVHTHTLTHTPRLIITDQVYNLDAFMRNTC